jgi:endoribonuclease Dicer
VGAFAADWVWRQAFKNVDEDPMNPIFEEDEDIIGESAIKEAKVKQDIYRTVKNWTFTMPNLDPTSRGFNVSPKITKLVQILQCFQQEGDEFRGVILGMFLTFGSKYVLILPVRRRITALAIVEVFKTISGQLQLMRPEALVGPWSHSKLTQVSAVCRT